MSRFNSAQIAVLGTGAVGTAVARTLAAANHRVVVWNRTAERAADAVSAGAAAAETAAQAVHASALTLVCMTDLDAAREVLAEVADPGDGTIRTIVLLTTGTPEESVRMGQLLAERSLGYLDAGVQTPPEYIGTPAAAFIIAGPRAAFERHQPVLDRLGTVHWVSQTPSAASLWDLVTFGLWYDAQLGLLRASEILRSSGVDPRAFAESARVTLGHVSDAATATADEVATDTHPRGPASLAEHLALVRQLVEGRRHARTGDGGMTHLESLIADLVASGADQEGLTAVLTQNRSHSRPTDIGLSAASDPA